jgi:hypothetical protein
MTSELSDTKHKLYEHVKQGALDEGVFASVVIDDRGVSCKALDAAEEAFYRVSEVDGAIWVSLETEDRWLSGSIEGDLVNTGDKLHDLIEEEVIDLGHEEAVVSVVDHFRSPEKIYVFRARLSTDIEDPKAVDHALIWLKGFEIVFRELGDMTEDDED